MPGGMPGGKWKKSLDLFCHIDLNKNRFPNEIP